eukprot:s615_g9.t1
MFDALEKGEIASSAYSMRDKYTALELMSVSQHLVEQRTLLQWCDSDHQAADGMTMSQKQDVVKKLVATGRWKFRLDGAFISAKKRKAMSRQLDTSASLDTDLERKPGKDEIGEEFSDWESEAEDNVAVEKHGFRTACDAIVASPAIHVLGPQESGPPSGLCGPEGEDLQVGGKEAEADPGCPILVPTPPTGTGMEVDASSASGAPQSRRASGAGEAAVPDLVSRMLGGLPGWAAFAAADESEEEVHNARGEHDTDDMLGLRAFELQQARGIEVPGTPTAAQARLAKRKQKAQEKAKRKTHLEVGTTESTGSHLFGMMSMLSNLTSATATGSARDDDEESVHNAWGGDDSDSKFVERAAELEHTRGMVVPVLKVQTAGRERLAKRRQRAEKKCNMHQEVAEEGDATAASYSGRAAASVFSAAATSIVQFQRLFNYVASSQDDEIDEVFCIWGEDDTPERFHERVAAMELARSDQSGRLPHHRVLRQKRKGRASSQKKDPDDPFLLDLRQQIECGKVGCNNKGLAGMESGLAASTGSLKATGKAKSVSLDGSRGAPLMMNAAPKTPGGRASKQTPIIPSKDVSPEQLQLFDSTCATTKLSNRESTGRLELFAYYGPVDEAGKLRGGIGGSHIHTDLEIRQMIYHQTREMLFTLFKKPRETVEVIVDGLMPAAMAYNYTWSEVKQLLKPCFNEMGSNGGKLHFAHMQKIILKSQKERLQALLKDKNAAFKERYMLEVNCAYLLLLQERGPKVPFQSKPQHALLAPIAKKQLNSCEEPGVLAMSVCCLGEGLSAGKIAEKTVRQDQNLQDQLVSNVILCRNPGDVDDRWDRYCAVRRVGKATYVKARNLPHSGYASMDDGLSDKHPGVSSLISAGYAKGPIL